MPCRCQSECKRQQCKNHKAKAFKARKSVAQIVKDYLLAIGADGLCNPDVGCGCSIDYLFACDEGFLDCIPAKKVIPDNSDSEYDYIFVPFDLICVSPSSTTTRVQLSLDKAVSLYNPETDRLYYPCSKGLLQIISFQTESGKLYTLELYNPGPESLITLRDVPATAQVFLESSDTAKFESKTKR